MNARLWLLLGVMSATAAMGKTDAATRMALVGAGSNADVEMVLDTATVLLSRDPDLQILDRAEVGRVLREHELSLSGLVHARDAVKAGQLLYADLFAVLEGTLTNESRGTAALGLVVFDAKNGARYADSSLVASNAVSAASATAAAVRAAVVKSRRSPADLHTIGLLLVRNADLPRQFDGLCDTVGLLLERELTASPGIAVLERRRLEEVNRERSLTPDAEGNHLLSSLRMMQLDVGRDGAGLRGTLAPVGPDGRQTDRITAIVPTRDPAALALLLADNMERFLKTPSEGRSADRPAEAARFHRESMHLIEHHEYVAAVRALDAALALAPEQTSWAREMALLLLSAAIELIDPGGQNWQRELPTQPTADNLASGLALGQRGADLLLDLSREAAERTRPGEPIPEVLRNSGRDGLCQLLRKLARVKPVDAATTAEIDALETKERTLRMEVLEPFLRKWSVNRTSFATYSYAVFLWLNMEGDRPHSSLPSRQRGQDDLAALSHWVEVSHKLNPPDGSGDYRPFDNVLLLFGPGQRDPVKGFRLHLEQDQDPVLRIYARVGKIASLMGPRWQFSDEVLAAEREFRLYAQDLLAHGDAARPGPLRNHLWDAIKIALSPPLNHGDQGREYLEVCRFALTQGDIQPGLFLRAVEALDDPRHRKLPEAMELVNGALKLVLEKPEAYPKSNWPEEERSTLIPNLQDKRDQLARELAGADPNVRARSPWKRSVCLLDLATPMNGFAWLFKPVVQDGQVFAAALGFHEWGVTEDSLQLVRVPLEGGPPSFLGRAKITGIDWINRPYVMERGPKSRLADYAAWLDVGRAACVGAGCYFAATGSGVFIFPTNGDPVLHLGTTDGLPSEDAHAVAFLDGKLYIGAGEVHRAGYLVAYEPATRKITVLASSRRSEHLSPWDDQPPFYAFGLVADPIRHRLFIALSSVIIPSNQLAPITPSMGLWTYLPSTGEFKRLVPLRLPTRNPPVTMPLSMWGGLADGNTVAVWGFRWTMALWDLRHDDLVAVYDSWAAQTNTTIGRCVRPVPTPGHPGQSKLVCSPFLLCDGWLYSAGPFERMALADGRTEQFPPLRTDYPFEPREALQLLGDGKYVLAADQYSLWLLDLSPEPERDLRDNRQADSAFTER